MKKILLAVPVVAGIAGASWAGTSLYSGNESRAAYEQVVADLDDALGLAVVTTEYRPGFLKSEAFTEVRFNDTPDSPVLARLHHEIEHSPVGTGENAGLSAARILTTVITDDVHDAKLKQVLTGFGDAHPVQLLSRVGFDGTVDNELSIAAYDLTLNDGSTIVSEPATWDFAVDSNHSFNGSGNWGGAVIESPTTIVNVSGMTDTFSRFTFRPRSRGAARQGLAHSDRRLDPNRIEHRLCAESG